MPAQLITLFEHEFRPYAELGLPEQPDALLDALERLNRANGVEIIRVERRGLRAGAVVGVLRAGPCTFQILPKLDTPGSADSDGPEQPAHTATRNLLAMLAYIHHLRIYEQDIAHLAAQPGVWFDLLVRLFANGLHQQILAGLSQNYQSQQETLSVLRGRWDVQRQALRHARTRHQFDVTYDELTADIPLNQVLAYVVEQLIPLTGDPTNRALLGDLREWFQPVRRLPQVNETLLDGIQFDRMNERYQPAYNMARLFLSGSTTQLTAGKLAGFSFVFDMNILYERFCAAFLEQHHADILPSAWQPASFLAQSEGRRIYLAHKGGRPALPLRPDLLLTRKGSANPTLIIDTKYKPLTPSRHGLGIDPADIYQMLAYSIRLKCDRALLLYPQSQGGGPVRERFDIEETGLRLFAATINLRVPLHPPRALTQELAAIFQFISE